MWYIFLRGKPLIVRLLRGILVFYLLILFFYESRNEKNPASPLFAKGRDSFCLFYLCPWFFLLICFVCSDCSFCIAASLPALARSSSEKLSCLSDVWSIYVFLLPTFILSLYSGFSFTTFSTNSSS